MSARQAFIPRPPSRLLSSEPQADARPRDGDDSDMFVDGKGKARSISAFLGQRRGTGADTASQMTTPTQGTGLGRTSASANRRSFEGIVRPAMTPMSIIPYPAKAQLGAGMRQHGVGQTPRMTAGQDGFPRPMTPVSAPRGPKKGLRIFARNREDEATSNGNANGSGNVFIEHEDEVDVHVGAGTGIGGYMRVFEGSGGGEDAGGLQSSLEHDIIAPVPGYALAQLGENPEEGACEVGGIFARSSRSLGVPAGTEVGMDKNDSQRNLGGTKRGMRLENMEESSGYADEDHATQRHAKRMKQVQHDPDEYFPISSPHIPPMPEPPTSSVDMLDPSLVVGSLLKNVDEFISIEEVEVNWKRWKGCTTEEWLKGTDELAKDYEDLLNMVKDHLTEKVLAYAGMISSVEKRQTEVNRNIETIHGKGNIVRENISKLATK